MPAALEIVPRLFGDHPRDADVEQAQVAIVAEGEVGRREVAVDDPAAMHVVEPAAGVETDHQRLRRRQQPPAIEHVAHTAAGEMLEREERNRVRLRPSPHPSRRPR